MRCNDYSLLTISHFMLWDSHCNRLNEGDIQQIDEMQWLFFTYHIWLYAVGQSLWQIRWAMINVNTHNEEDIQQMDEMQWLFFTYHIWLHCCGIHSIYDGCKWTYDKCEHTKWRKRKHEMYVAFFVSLFFFFLACLLLRVFINALLYSLKCFSMGQRWLELTCYWLIAFLDNHTTPEDWYRLQLKITKRLMRFWNLVTACMLQWNNTWQSTMSIVLLVSELCRFQIKAYFPTWIF